MHDVTEVAADLYVAMSVIAKRQGVPPANVQAYVLGDGSCVHRKGLWRACAECGRDALSAAVKDEVYAAIVVPHQELRAADKRAFWQLCRDTEA